MTGHHEPLSRRHLLLTAATSGAVAALASGADGPRPGAAAARAEDVATINAILAAIYDVISGPKGRARDWDRMRGLFAPGARLIPCQARGDDGRVAIQMMGVDDYIARFGPALAEYGFIERQIAHRVERFGHMAQVFSTYETRLDGASAIQGRGINGIQLFWDEKRWWVASIIWDAESPTQAIPANYDAK